MLTEEEKKTLAYYNTHAEEWSSERDPYTTSFWEGDIEKFHSLLPSGKIFEIGSGSGREASRFISLGYDYIGTDISEGLLHFARKNNPGGKFLLETVYRLGLPSGSFDGFWTSATLIHVPKSRILEALEKIRGIVKPDGIGFISLKEGRGEDMTLEASTGRYFSYYQLDEFSEILSGARLEIIEAERKREVRTNGEVTDWLTFFVRI